MKRFLKDLIRIWRYRILFRYKLEAVYRYMVRIRNKFSGNRIALDASSICQLNCPACSTANKDLGTVGWGFLTFDHFKRLIDENADVKFVELSNWGEILLNPELPEIIRYAYENGIRLTALNGVNLNNVKDKTLEYLVKYKFRALSVSIDGATGATYEIYRRKGNFKVVIGNIRRINELKKKYRSSYPDLYWQFIVFGHNEHELMKAKAMARELGMIFRPKLNHTSSYSPIRDAELVRRESGLSAASREEYQEQKNRRFVLPCYQLWDNPQINWDGKLLGCCVNKTAHFGNVFETSLQDALRSEPYRYAQKMILGKTPPRDDIPCTQCEIYRDLLNRHTHL